MSRPKKLKPKKLKPKKLKPKKLKPKKLKPKKLKPKKLKPKKLKPKKLNLPVRPAARRLELLPARDCAIASRASRTIILVPGASGAQRHSLWFTCIPASKSMRVT